MTWAVYSKEFDGPLHVSGSFAGARRWSVKFVGVDKVTYRHIAGTIAPADALILFRMFLKETGYHHGLIIAEYIADAFNSYLRARHPLTLESISTQRMSRILRSWGLNGKSVNHGVKRWSLTLHDICPSCGGHLVFASCEAVCTNCGAEVS